MKSESPPKTESKKNAAALASREALLAEVRALAGATLQKLWLTSTKTIALQLRIPGNTKIVAIDSERAMALVADERPASPESALKAQATLRAALSGARFDSAELVLPVSPNRGSSDPRQAALRISFTTPSGIRVLVAEPRAQALLLSANGFPGNQFEKIIWTAPGAAAPFRSGEVIAPWRVLASNESDPDLAIDPDRSEKAARELAAETLETRAEERFAEEKQQLVRALAAKVKKLARTLEAVERDSSQARKAIDARKFAELLLPHQSRIPRGAKEAIVPDWSQLDEEGNPAQIAIALDPALGAAENASRMLKKAHRYLAAASRITARLAEVARAHEEGKAQLARVEAAKDLAELRSFSIGKKSEHRAQPFPARSGAIARLPYRTFRASNQARILVGRSAKDNDTLTLRHARGDDLWLHARGVHGSHVILLDPGSAPDTRALAEAALLAAHFSSARGADGSEVSWTRRKYVHKGKGMAPGAVTFSQEKTVRVRLDEAVLNALLAREEK